MVPVSNLRGIANCLRCTSAASRRKYAYLFKGTGDSHFVLSVLLRCIAECKSSIWAPTSRLIPLDVETAISERDSNPDTELAQAYGEVVDLLGRDTLRYFKDMLFARQLMNEEDAHHEGLAEASVHRDDRVCYPVEVGSSGMDDDRSDEEDLATFMANSSKTKQKEMSKTTAVSLWGDEDSQRGQAALTATALPEEKTEAIE